MASSEPLVELTDSRQLPQFTKSEIERYLKRIALPTPHSESPILADPSLARTELHGLPLLRALHRYHVSTIPFENLELHYSKTRSISLNARDLYVKFVDQAAAGRGGRCMENNTFFGTVLRSLGYDVRNCGGRVSRMMNPDREIREKLGDTYDGWNHMLNLVRVESRWWVVDVGMGAMGPNCVYPLEDGFEGVAIPPRKIRMQLRTIPEHARLHSSGEVPKLWCYDVCHKPKSETQSPANDQWIPTYCFTETEFLPQDYEMMSWYTSTHKRSFFTSAVLCTKMLLDEKGEEVIGDITLFNEAVRRTVAGERTVVTELKTEPERLQALHNFFGVNLSDEQAAAIGEARLPSRR